MLCVVCLWHLVLVLDPSEMCLPPLADCLRTTIMLVAHHCWACVLPLWCLWHTTVVPVVQICYLMVVSFIGTIIMSFIYFSGATWRPIHSSAQQ